MATRKIQRKSPIVPARVVEITLVGTFSRPASWQRRDTPQGDAAEIKLMQAGTWHPCTEDFLAVANVPNARAKLTTVHDPIGTFGQVLGAILDTADDGETHRRAPRSIKRLNLISHGLGESGRTPIYGLSGDIADDGGCFLHGSLEEAGTPGRPLQSRGIDEALLDWLDTRQPELRDQCRQRFREDGEIGLILCNSGGSSFARNVANLAQRLARTFDVAVLAFDDEVVYHSYFEHERFVRRDLTSVGQSGTQGRGYACAVPVPKELAGTHLRFSPTASVAKPAKSAP